MGAVADLLQVATYFKASNGFIIVLAYQQPGSVPIPQICDLASPGMCFFADASQSNEDLVDKILQAFCIGKRLKVILGNNCMLHFSKLLLLS